MICTRRISNVAHGMLQAAYIVREVLEAGAPSHKPFPMRLGAPSYVTSLGQKLLKVRRDRRITIEHIKSNPRYFTMASREPPWRNDRARLPQRSAPGSAIPAKRSADSRAQEHAAKRSTNAAEDAWVADEDRFVLQQAKKKAALRVKGGRARPIDWLAVTLRFIDKTEESILDEEIANHDLDVVDPEGVLEGLGNADLAELEKEIDHYLTLETNRSNRDYWTVRIPPADRSILATASASTDISSL